MSCIQLQGAFDDRAISNKDTDGASFTKSAWYLRYNAACRLNRSETSSPKTHVDFLKVEAHFGGKGTACRPSKAWFQIHKHEGRPQTSQKSLDIPSHVPLYLLCKIAHHQYSLSTDKACFQTRKGMEAVGHYGSLHSKTWPTVLWSRESKSMILPSERRGGRMVVTSGQQAWSLSQCV